MRAVEKDAITGLTKKNIYKNAPPTITQSHAIIRIVIDMKKNLKKVVAFTALSCIIVGLVVGSLALLSNNTLKHAAVNCDTITINATLDGTTLTARQTVEYKNRTNQTLDEIKFHIYANAYREGATNPPVGSTDIADAYPNGKSYGNITIGDVTGGSHTIGGADETVLSVALDAPLAPNKTAKINIDYIVALANIKHRLGWTNDAINLANFYPVPCIFENGDWATYPYSSNGDPFYNAVHNFDVTLTHDANLVVATSGQLASSRTRGDQTTTVARSTAIRDFAAVLSTKFKQIDKTKNGITVKYYYLTDDQPSASLDVAVRALEKFSDIFTPYPYKTLSVVQTDFLHGGMEYGELVYISTAVIADRPQHEYVIVHEIAHQWWYGTCGNNQSTNAWIDEGLAEYSTMLFFDDRAKMEKTAKESYATYIKTIRALNAKLDTNMNRHLNAFNNSHEYVYMTYVRGLLLFCELESLLSRPTLLAALADFALENQFSIGSQSSLLSALNRHAGQSMQQYLETHLAGTTQYFKV